MNRIVWAVEEKIIFIAHLNTHQVFPMRGEKAQVVKDQKILKKLKENEWQ